MLEVKNYNDEELAKAIGIGSSTLKNKRKVTEQRHLKNYEWSRDKKKKLYTIRSFKEDIQRNSIEDTFESLIANFSNNQVPLENKEKALAILGVLFKVKENFAEELALYADVNQREIHRYVKKFRELGIVVQKQYDYYLIADIGEEWEAITNEEAAHIKDYWFRIVRKQFDIRNIPPHSRDLKRIQECKDIANAIIEEEFGQLRRVEHKYLTDEAIEYFGPFLEYAGRELKLMVFN
jgi:hypothetical protein